ncbi:MAG: tetratricopeptide repeat protein [Cyclobacteriaceae bacterium]
MKQTLTLIILFLSICPFVKGQIDKLNILMTIGCEDYTKKGNYCTSLDQYVLLNAGLKEPSFRFYLEQSDETPDYRVDFQFKFYEGEFILSSTIDRGKVLTLNDFAPQENFQLKTEAALVNIIDKIRSLEFAKTDIVKIGILPKTAPEVMKSVVRNSLVELRKQLLSTSKVNIVNVDSLFFPTMSTKDLFALTKLDGLILVDYEGYKNGRVIAVPNLYIKDLPKVTLSKILVEERSDYLKDDFYSIIDYLVNENGSWNQINLNLLKAALRNDDDLLDRAEKYFTETNYFLSAVLINKYRQNEELRADRKALNLLTKVRIKQGRLAEAEYILAEISDKQLSAVFLEGILYFKKARYYEAKEKLNFVFKSDSSFFDSDFGSIKEFLGLTYLEIGMKTDAVKLFKSLVTIYPNESKYKYLLGKSLFDLGRYDEAIAQFQSVDKSYLNTSFYLSDCFAALAKKKFMESDLQAALMLFNKAFQYHPSENITKDLIKVNNRLGLLKTSDSLINKANNIEINYFHASDLGEIYDDNRIKGNIDNKYLEKAMIYIGEYIKEKPNEAKAFWLIGSLNTSGSEFKVALENFRKATELDQQSVGYRLDYIESLIINENYDLSYTLSDSLCRVTIKNRSKRNNIISIYLRTISLILLKDLGKSSEEKIVLSENELLRNAKGKFFLNWYFDSFKHWVSTKSFKDPNTSGRLLSLTREVEMKDIK